MDILFDIEDSGGDFRIEDNDIVLSDALCSKIFLALFTDSDYWGNTFQKEKDRVGSAFEPFMNNKEITIEDLEKIERQCKQILNFLVESGEVSDILVTVSNPVFNYLIIAIVAIVGDARKEYNIKYRRGR